MKKLILISVFLCWPLSVYADCTPDKPCANPTIEYRHAKDKWEYHKSLTDAAIAAQKQRDADFEKHRLEVKVKEAADKAAGKP